MPSLRELQTRMMGALLQGASEDAAALLDAPPATALSRLQVYENNVRSNFAEALRSTYPAIRRLVGEDYFGRSAREFQRRHPSPSGDLVQVGRFFSEYLAQRHADDEFGYLADVARLEWLVQEALLAAEHAPLNLEKMAGVAASAYDTLRFELHPAVRLFESRYPVLRIWEVNVSQDSEPEVIDLGSGADRVIVMRQRLQLRFQRLSRGDYCLLDRFRQGAGFAAAVDAATACDDEFDASRALQRFVASGVIVDFR